MESFDVFEQEAARIVDDFLGYREADDLQCLKEMIVAALREAYERGRRGGRRGS